MIKILGNVVVLVALYAALMADPTIDNARTAETHQLLAERIGLYGLLALAAGQLIIIGGIDLSIGSTIALASVLLSWLVVGQKVPLAAAIPLVLLAGAAIGLFHGLMVTATRVQAFVVTLCGLFIYRSLARLVAGDVSVGLPSPTPLHRALTGEPGGVPVQFLIFLALLALLGVFLHFSRHGRYFFAIGSNEKAAHYCGIATTRYKVLAYVLCSTLTCLYAVLNMLNTPTARPSDTGSAMELYGIAAAVIGGCSLRGGEGNVLGMFLGACIICIVPTYVTFKTLPEYLDGVVFGVALLIGAVLDEVLRRYRGVRGPT